MRRAASAFLALAACGWAAPAARAGGGPETTVVVVNADSPLSRQVANAYARMRSIPATHLVEVSGVPTLGVVDLETFRKRLWAPVKAALEERGLLDTTDVLAWSADFPFAVDVAAAATEAKAQAYPNVPWRASLTGLAYFWRRVEESDLRTCCDLSGNRYF